MKKHLLLLFVALSFFSASRAQWVPIDPVFASYISTYVQASAINGNLLDTTNTTIVSLRNLTTNYSDTTTDITGIQYFDSLQNLIVNSGRLQFIPLLPQGLLTAEFAYANLYMAGPLPANLIILKITSNGFTAFPALPASLKKLNLNGFNNVAVLPALPTGLQHLEITNTSVGMSLPAIPATVTHLNLSSTRYGPVNTWALTPDTFICASCPSITSMPNLPANMTYLDVNYCPVTNMGTVPRTMSNLNLSNTRLATVNLPDTVSANLLLNNMSYLTPLTYINSLVIGYSFSADYTPNADVGSLLGRIIINRDLRPISISATNCNISSLPQLNTLVDDIDLSYNSLTSLPYQSYAYIDTSATPDRYYAPFTNFTNYNFSHCAINSISSGFFQPQYFYNYGYNTIDLSYNNLTAVYSDIGDAGSYIDYSNNQITDYYPTVLGYGINLSYNQLNCLPFIDAEVRTLRLISNPIDCIPNIPNPNFNVSPQLDVCYPGNTHNCPAQPITGGHIFNDANQNALRDSTEVILAGQTATMLPGGFLHISDSTGLYKFNCKINQQYQLKGVANFPYRRVTTPVVNVNYSGVGIVDTTHNIGMYIQPNVNDLMVRITPFVEARPGFNHHYNIAVRNEGTTIQNGNLVFYFDPSLIYQASQPAGTVSGYSISWPLTALNPLAGFNATADFIIPAAVPLGQRVKAGAYALGNTPDTTITDNHDTIQQIAVGSYDPNDKQVFPAQGISLEEVESGTGGYLEYLVRFQNTGTASAINVRVEDTLHAHLDLNTFELLGSSHTYRYVIENRVLKVYFDNINLPDSGASEKLSHGFFRYRIRATASISTASRLPNTAYIYFDFNAPVVTNTALTQVTSVFAVQPISQQLCTGEHMLLYAKASSPVISQQWYKDGLPTGITTDTLYIDSVSTATIGQYTFRISVGGNELISHVANVHVFGIPTPYTSVQLPGPNGANKADTLKFCNTANFSNQQFSVHGNNLQGSTIYNWAINGTVISRGPTNDLTLNYHVWHNGDRLVCYTIVPCSGYALADTIIFEMATTSEVQQVNIVPDTPHICPGQSVTFTTNSLYSDPYSTKWYKNGIQVSTYTSYTAYNLTTSDVIIVYQSNLQDAGCYVMPNPLDTTHVIIDSNAHLPTPNLNFNIAAPPFCPGNRNTIGPSVNYSGSNAQYQWQLNGQVVNTPGATFSSDSFHIGDVVQYRIIRNTCGTDTFYSGTYTIAPDTNQRDATIVPYIQSNCEWVNFGVANGNNATSYLWKINGVTQNPYSSSGVTRVEGRADTIIVVVRFNNPCLPASLSDTLILPPFSKTHRQLLPLKPSNNPFCAVEQVTISNPNNFPQPQYYKNGVALNINYLGQVAIRDSVAYTITAVYPPTGCYLADTLSITLTPGEIPVTTAAITYTPGTVCARQPVVCSINANGSFISAVYWSAYKNNVLIGGSYGGTTCTLDTLVDSTTVYANVRLGCAGNITIAAAPVTLRLTEQIPTVDISALYPGLCNGNIANTFSADGFYLGSAPIYQWLKNGLPAGSNSYRYADSALQNNDKVYCKVISNNPCIVSPFVVSDTLTMQTGTTVIPTVAITASAGTTCGQQPLTFTAQPFNGGANPVYQWFINNLQVTGAATNTFTHGNFTNGDLVSATLMSSAPCPVPPLVYSAPLNIQVITPQVPQISITGSNNMVCPGGTLSYNASFTNAGANPQLQWIINSTGTNQGGTAFTTNALHYGDGVVCMLNTIGGCYEPTILVSNVILAAVYPGPDTPLITFSGGVYSCSPASAYQWYINQVAVNGATAQTFTPLQTGQIQVEVTDSNGCKLLSPPYMLTAISATANDSYVHLSPNPAHNAVSLRVSSNFTGNEYTLTNVLGQVVATGHIQQNNTTINTSTFAPGFYQLRVGNVVKRLVKE